MRRFPSWSNYSRGGALVAGAVLVLIGIVLTGFATLNATVAAAQTDNQALEMFGEMMPVFTSPRCLNCHGGINPFQGDSHAAGAIDVPVDANGDMSSDDKDKKVWFGEMRIPFAKIDRREPKDGIEMRINFYRIQGPGPDRKLINWQPVNNDSFHTPEAFGRLRLSAKAP